MPRFLEAVLKRLQVQETLSNKLLGPPKADYCVGSPVEEIKVGFQAEMLCKTKQCLYWEAMADETRSRSVRGERIAHTISASVGVGYFTWNFSIKGTEDPVIVLSLIRGL